MDRIRKYCAITLALLFLLSCSLKDKEREEQIATIRTFYSVILSLNNDGIPSKDDIEKLSPYISGSFKNLLLQARKTEDKYYQKTKGSIPPLIEGSLFFSLFEGADRLISVKKEGKGQSFLAKLEYKNPYGKNEIVQWQDRIVLINENNKWVVDDIELLGQWQFGAKGKVSEIIKAVIEQEKNT